MRPVVVSLSPGMQGGALTSSARTQGVRCSDACDSLCGCWEFATKTNVVL